MDRHSLPGPRTAEPRLRPKQPEAPQKSLFSSVCPPSSPPFPPGGPVPEMSPEQGAPAAEEIALFQLLIGLLDYRLPLPPQGVELYHRGAAPFLQQIQKLQLLPGGGEAGQQESSGVGRRPDRPAPARSSPPWAPPGTAGGSHGFSRPPARSPKAGRRNSPERAGPHVQHLMEQLLGVRSRSLQRCWSPPVKHLVDGGAGPVAEHRRQALPL